MLIVALTLNPIALLLWLIVLCVVVWAARAIMAAFNLPQPVQTVVFVLLVLIIVLYLVQLLGGGPSLQIG